MTIEAFLGLMVFVLALLLLAIVRTPPMTGSAAAATMPGADAALPGWPEDISGAVPGPVPQPRTVAPGPALSGQPQVRRGRYQARHGRGYVPPPRRPPGPPWEQAQVPPR